MPNMIWPEPNSLAPPCCSYHFKWRLIWRSSSLLHRFSVSARRVQRPQRASRAQTSIQTHTVKLIIHTRYQGVFCFISLASSTTFIPSPLSRHLLFFTAGRYELPARTPGNYGNSFSLNYSRTVAGETPDGELHHHNQVCMRTCTNACLHSIKNHTFTHLTHHLPQVLTHTLTVTFHSRLPVPYQSFTQHATSPTYPLTHTHTHTKQSAMRSIQMRVE